MCLQPRTVVIPYLRGGRKAILVPCGKCLECLKRYQNDMMIRIVEESKNWPKMVFFTLTYAPHTVHTRHVDIDDFAAYYETGDFDSETLSPIVEYYDALSPESRSYLESHDGNFMEVNVKDVQAWLKRFREYHVQYVSRTDGVKRSDVERLKMKYFFTTEYGPQTLRPHGHGLIWYDFPDYLIHRLFSLWSKRFGYVDYHILPAPKSDIDSTVKIARYVAKYCSKGMFESPLVKDGIAKKCSKLMSKGIGSCYADNRKEYHLAMDICALPAQSYFWGSFELPVLSRLVLSHKHKKYYFDQMIRAAAAFQAWANNKPWAGRVLELSQDDCLFEPVLDVNSPIVERCNYTMLGSDGKLYKYPLPRYLKHKIYGEKSLISLALSAALAESVRLDYQERVRAYRSKHPNATDFEVSLAVDSEDSRIRHERAAAFHERTLRHYKKSKL